ncbi:hypothetical protein KC324_g13221 [Hortaea werneckii]|nr:hypothetical protein KC324_g13221 [Hortaea werneckii]
MSTAVAAPPPSSSSSSFAPNLERHSSPRSRSLAAIAPSNPNHSNHASAAPSAEPAAKRARSNGSPNTTDNHHPPSVERSGGSGKASPNTGSKGGAPPMIKVKKEPGSPSMPSSRPRPKRLDLSSSNAPPRGPQTARPSAPLTARDSAGLAIQDVGLACLSPGFATHDPAMREQLQRSLDVRDQQRMIIEARQKGQKPGSSHEASAPAGPQDTTLFGVPTRTPSTSRRKGPPPGLSINAPSAESFANDRVIQSAPLHQTFTGLRPGEAPSSRHVQHGPSALSQTSHIHHVPATQTSNRLPPIADVFANDRLDPPRGFAQSPAHPQQQQYGPPPIPSPSFPPRHHHGPPLSARAREFRSAEEAMQGLSGGREDLMPKVVHYGGVQPPTPPSPMPHGGSHQQPHSGPGAAAAAQPPSHAEPMARPDVLARTSSMNGRRRGRDEYGRDNGSPPSAYNRQEPKRAAFAVRGEDDHHQHSQYHRGHDGGGEEDWKRHMSSAEKKEEFLRLCERAWDLFHS